MFFVYDLRLDGMPVYEGIADDLGKSLARHLVEGKRFDALHVRGRTEELEVAKRAAARRYGIAQSTRVARHHPHH